MKKKIGNALLTYRGLLIKYLMCEVKKKNIKETSPRRVPPRHDTTNAISVANNNELQLN